MHSTRFDSLTRSLATVTSRRKTLKAGGTGVAVATLGAVGLRGAQAQEASPAATNADDLQLLFIQNAGATTLAPGTDGNHVLTMSGVTAQTLYFSDRPNRIAGAMLTEALISAWAESFADNPPNATLIGHLAAGDEAEEAVVLELMDPVYDGAAGTLTYQVRILQVDEIGERTFEQEPLTALDTPHEYAEAHLFIDDLAVCIFCVGGAAVFTIGILVYKCAEVCPG